MSCLSTALRRVGKNHQIFPCYLPYVCVYKLKDILLLDTLAMALHRGGSLLESEDVPDPGLLLEGPLDLLKRGLFNKRKLHDMLSFWQGVSQIRKLNQNKSL